MTKTCCVTGHREIPTSKLRKIKLQLWQQVGQAIESGYTRFISGFAQGADLIFAECVLEYQKHYPDIYLEAAIPYARRIKREDGNFQQLYAKCTSVKIFCDEYRPDCFMLRNRYMVEQSSRVIAVYDGRTTGGTVFTMRYACSLKREMKVIEY